MNILDKTIEQCISVLNRWHLKRINKYNLEIPNNEDNFEALIPNTQDEEKTVEKKKNSERKKTAYSNPFLFALRKPNVNNIAITGSYGSGKSSFLRKFEKENAGWNYLPISLAKFADTEENSNLHQDIERSILQQFFYREKDKTIPFSRFKKIKKVSKIDILLLAVSIPYLYTYIFRPKVVHNLLSETILDFTHEYNYIFLGLAILLFLAGFYRLLYFLSSFQISKLDMNKNSITVSKQDKASILNEHLDEILYFFEATNYNVVIFEDIDRFNNTEIFVKLRELNNLINNSKQVNRRVVFVYAIRDDMFIDKERTKFFDFIVPVIPYINPSNSEQKLIDKFEKEIENGTLNEQFLTQISWYIDDMRLLINVYNEYMIYKNNLNSKSLNHNKLLALIICKNFYPLDFAKLHVRDGAIYKLFLDKPKYIESQIGTYKSQKRKLLQQIKAIESENIQSLEELKIIYLGQLFAETNADLMTINDLKQKTFNELLQTNILDEINSDTTCVIYNKEGGYNYQIQINQRGQKNFGEIEDIIDEKNSYFQRKELIDNKSNNKIDELKKEIENIDKKINKLGTSSLKELFEIASEHIVTEDYKDKDLLIFLVRNGYIDKYYEHYISYFHEGGITQDDREFLLGIQNHKALNFTAQLGNIPKLLDKLDEKSFDSEYILNNKITSHFFKYASTTKKEKYFIQVSNGSDKSIEFIFQYMEYVTDEEKTLFIKQLSWDGLWTYIDKNLSTREKNKYFKLLFDTLDIDRLVELNVSSYLSKQTILPKYTEEDNKKCMDLIDRLNVSFVDIENPSDNPPLFNYIYENGHYIFSPKMIEIIIKEKGNIESSEIDNLGYKNLTIIRESEAEKLIECINSNINEYWSDVLYELDENTKESEDTLVYLLNHEDLGVESKENIIKRLEAKISDITSVKVKELWVVLFKENKVDASWDNVFNYYIEKKELDSALFKFLNDDENTKELSVIKIGGDYFKEHEEFSDKGAETIFRKILEKNEFDDTTYKLLSQSCGYWYNDLNLSELSENKIKILINTTNLKPDAEAYSAIAEQCKVCAIIFMARYINKYLDDKMEVLLSSNIVLGLINSEKITNEEKFKVIEKIDNSIFDENKELKENVSKLCIDTNENIENIDLFDKLFYGDNQYDLELLVSQLDYFDECENIKPYLEALSGRGYKELVDINASKHYIDDNELNRKLLEKLKTKDCISSWRENKKALGKNDLKVERKRV